MSDFHYEVVVTGDCVARLQCWDVLQQLNWGAYEVSCNGIHDYVCEVHTLEDAINYELKQIDEEIGGLVEAKQAIIKLREKELQK